VAKKHERVEVSLPALRELLETCATALDTLGNIRYCEWPTLGLGIGLNPGELDAVMLAADAAMGKIRRQIGKHKALMQEIEQRKRST
jgi:hypothetical protein